jgi:tellurite resistance protein TerC
VGETFGWNGGDRRNAAPTGEGHRVHVDLWIWVAFVGFIVALLLVDLLVFQRHAHAVSIREAAWWSVFWVALGLSFCGLIWAWQGSEAAGEYLAGYLLEKSLSVDNIFVFALILGYFAVPAEFQHRVLFWGVLGALLFRALFIAAGAALLDNFHWLVYVFGAFLIITGIRMARSKDDHVDPGRNPILRVFRRFVPMTEDYRGPHFLTHDAGRLLATPLLAVLVVIETTDIVFAIDSIPAIFAVTDDTFLIFTSNAFAILGLRAMYFLLAGLLGKFEYLKVGLAIILVYVGAKMLLEEWVHIPIVISLLVIVISLAVAVIASLRRNMVAVDTRVHTGGETGDGAGPPEDQPRERIDV